MTRAYTFHYPLGGGKTIVVSFEQRHKSERCPSGVRFAVIGLVEREGTAKEVIRIDNAAHRGTPRTHIHEGKSVRFKDFASYEEACDYVEAYLRGQGYRDQDILR